MYSLLPREIISRQGMGGGVRGANVFPNHPGHSSSKERWSARFLSDGRIIFICGCGGRERKTKKTK